MNLVDTLKQEASRLVNSLDFYKSDERLHLEITNINGRLMELGERKNGSHLNELREQFKDEINFLKKRRREKKELLESRRKNKNLGV